MGENPPTPKVGSVTSQALVLTKIERRKRLYMSTHGFCEAKASLTDRDSSRPTWAWETLSQDKQTNDFFFFFLKKTGSYSSCRAQRKQEGVGWLERGCSEISFSCHFKF